MDQIRTRNGLAKSKEQIVLWLLISFSVSNNSPTLLDFGLAIKDRAIRSVMMIFSHQASVDVECWDLKPQAIH
jgi:hypothetical protein